MAAIAPSGARRRAVVMTALAGLSSLLARPARAQASRDALRIIVPWPPGGATDVASRVFAQKLAELRGTPVFIDNRAGANGQIGATVGARAAADGATMLIASAEIYLTLGGHKPQYDAMRDFAPIAPFARNPFVLVSRADFPADSLPALLQVVRAKPGVYTYGSPGVGSLSQIAMETLKMRAGAAVLHVPYLGGAPAEAALLGGQIDLQMLPLGRTLALAGDHRIKVFGITTAERSPLLPVATIAEQGFPGFDVANWFGLVAPAGIPEAVVQKTAHEVSMLLASAPTRAALHAVGVEPFTLSPTQFRQFIAAESARLADVLTRSNIKLDS